MHVHTAAWWVWTMGIATAALLSTNLALLGLLGFVIVTVVRVHRPEGHRDDAMRSFLKLALAVITIRVMLQAIVAPRSGGTVVFALPSITLPSWAAGVSLGGPVTAEGLVAALRTGLQLAIVLVAFGAANTVTSPARLLRLLPVALYELGVAATVALSSTPHALATARAIRAARRLRGRPTRGLSAFARTVVPTLEVSLARSVDLAASMDARGFGRRSSGPARRRRASNAVLGLGFVLICVGLYGVFAPATPWGMGTPLVLGGGALATTTMMIAGQTGRRSRYRPEPWNAVSFLVAASGVAVGAAMWRLGVSTPAIANPPAQPLAWPGVSTMAALGVGIGLVPVLVRSSVPVSRSSAPSVASTEVARTRLAR